MNSELQLKSITPANFVNGIKREYQTFLIVKLIKESIEAGQRITRDEIIECYLRKKFINEHSSALGWVKLP